MELANLKVVKGWQITQNRAPAAIEGIIAKPDQQIIPVPIQVRKGRHLDVDEILRRSLPEVSQPTVLRRVNKLTPAREDRILFDDSRMPD